MQRAKCGKASTSRSSPRKAACVCARTSSSSTRRPTTACCATGRGRTPASTSTRAIRCSGTRSPCWPRRCSSCCLSAVSPKAKLLLVGLACSAPFVLGTAAYFLGWGGGGAEAAYGELVAPRTLAGAPFDALRGKWVLVSFDAAACDAYCEKKLYFMRQIRTAQHKDMG